MTDAIAGIVKPLQFADEHDDGILTSRETGELFRVIPQSDGTFWAPKLPNPSCTTADEAVAKLNAAHTARILAAIDADALQAMIGAAYEAAARNVQSDSGTDEEADFKAYLAHEIRALTPADATAALARYGARMRAEGREEGREEAVQRCISVARQALVDMAHEFRGETQKVSKVAFAAERLVTDRLRALAAQTEEAANG